MNRGRPLRRRAALERTAWVRTPRAPLEARRRAHSAPRKPDNPDKWTEPAGRRACRARSGGRCEARQLLAERHLEALEGCTGRHDHTHHVAGRRGPDPHHPDNLLGLCWSCHRIAHEATGELRVLVWAIGLRRR